MRRAVPFLLLMIGSAALLLGGLGRLPLLGRDESLYAEAAREMAATGDWITPRVNGGPFFEKPPLNYWLAAVCFRTFGVSTFAARLPAALAALLTVALTAALGARLWGRRAGLLAGIALLTSLQIAIIGRMGIMDVPLMCLTTLALLAYARWRTARGPSLILMPIGFGLSVGLAVLLKGLAGLLPVGIAGLHWLASCLPRRGVASATGSHTRSILRPFLAVLTVVLVCLAVAVPWFHAMANLHGNPFVSTLLGREHLARIAQPMQGHGGSVLYYLGVIAVSFFPWIIFLPPALLSRAGRADQAQALWHSLLVVWFAAVLIPFSLISTKLPGYVTPLFPAMALLVGAELDRRLDEPRRALWIAVIVGAVALAGLTSLLPSVGARLGDPIGAAHAASRLIPPAVVWIAGYGVIVLGAATALSRRAHAALALVVTGQMVAVGAVLIGILPVLSPYLEGGRESRLAELAQRELPQSQVVLYDTRPEAVAFVLGRPVRCYGRDEAEQALSLLKDGPTALIAPAKDEGLWEGLPVRRVWSVGDRVLLDIPRVTGNPQR